jgi:hypothetical protein
MEIWQILTLVFALLSIFLGIYWVKAKDVLSEIAILLAIISEALKDDTLTKEELELIVAQIQKIINSFKVKTIKEASEAIKTMKNK